MPPDMAVDSVVVEEGMVPAGELDAALPPDVATPSVSTNIVAASLMELDNINDSDAMLLPWATK